MINQIDISVVIVNWNSKEYLSTCIDSILNNSIDIFYEIIIVDNASSDGSAEFIKLNYPNVVLIKSEKNLGYNGGNNLGIIKSRGDFIFILNPDTKLENNVLSILSECLTSNDKLGVVGSNVVLDNGLIQKETIKRFPSISSYLFQLFFLHRILKSKYFLGYADEDQPSAIVDVHSGENLMLRRSDLNKIGLLDERFFLYGDDIDLCWQIKKKLGLLTFYKSEALITHFNAGSTSKNLIKAEAEVFLSDFLFAYKNYYFIYALLVYLLLIIHILSRVILYSFLILIKIDNAKEKFQSHLLGLGYLVFPKKFGKTFRIKV